MDAPPNLDEIPLPPPTPSNLGEEIKRSILDSSYLPAPPIQQQQHTSVQIKVLKVQIMSSVTCEQDSPIDKWAVFICLLTSLLTQLV